VSAFETFKRSFFCHLYFTPFNSQDHSPNQGLRNLVTGGCYYPSKGLPRDIHVLGCFFVVHALEIRESNCFQLVHLEDDLIEIHRRNARWFEQ